MKRIALNVLRVALLLGALVLYLIPGFRRAASLLLVAYFLVNLFGIHFLHHGENKRALPERRGRLQAAWLLSGASAAVMLLSGGAHIAFSLSLYIVIPLFAAGTVLFFCAIIDYARITKTLRP